MNSGGGGKAAFRRLRGLGAKDTSRSQLQPSEKRKKHGSSGPYWINRIFWLVILVGVGIGAFFSGQRILYLAAAVLLVLPFVSYVITFLLLRGLRVFRSQPNAVLKNETGVLNVRLHNNFPVPLGSVGVIIHADEHAISVLENQTVPIFPFGKQELEIPFQIEFRGHYRFGLAAVQVTDITGLFRLSRSFDATKQITALPQIADLSNFPLTMNLMTQASSRHDIRDEDYTTISDIRQYLPTDSIKRVHWKLTAKRNEWLVKNFQSNALNQVSLILDTQRISLPPRDTYELEDRMVEYTLGVAKFCLNKGMPIDFRTTQGNKSNARNAAEFAIIYHAAGGLKFESETALDTPSIISQELNDATGYVNAVIITANLTPELYERILHGTSNGHYIAILYFAPPEESPETQEIYKLLSETGTPCFRITSKDNTKG